MDPLLIMVAPNGARRTKADHPALPITADELADTAAACLAAGATAMHVHVRDDYGGHVLDATRYREAIAAIRDRTEDRMITQVTTEAVGRYTPTEQMELVHALRPIAVSIAWREIAVAGEDTAQTFFSWAKQEGVAIQHILYDRADLDAFLRVTRCQTTSTLRPRLLFVLGRYSQSQESRPEDLEPFLDGLQHYGLAEAAIWSVCAFGRNETAALVEALRRGGHVRVGFENSLWSNDGTIARDNSERVAIIARIARESGRALASPQQARSILCGS